MAKFKIVWTKFAEESLYEILEFYIIHNGNNAFSTKLYGEIISAIQTLELFPDLGKLNINTNYRELVLNRNSVYYKVKEDIIELLLVWDNRRNPAELITTLEGFF